MRFQTIPYFTSEVSSEFEMIKNVKVAGADVHRFCFVTANFSRVHALMPIQSQRKNKLEFIAAVNVTIPFLFGNFWRTFPDVRLRLHMLAQQHVLVYMGL